MWGTVWWASGWRTMTVALLWWGTNYPARFTYIGGAFLRADWLAFAVIGICLARRGYLVPAGAAVGWSALLRVFPAFMSAALLWRWLTRRRGVRTSFGEPCDCLPAA